jgi:Bacterial low temperature requirement A protein (LtrA)
MYLHVIIVAGVILSGVGDEVVIEHPTGDLADAEVAVVAGGPALYLLGHVAFRLRLTGRISLKRLGGAVACVIAGLTGTAVQALALATLLVVVLVVVLAVEQVGETRRLAHGAPSRFDQPEASVCCARLTFFQHHSEFAASSRMMCGRADPTDARHVDHPPRLR